MNCRNRLFAAGISAWCMLQAPLFAELKWDTRTLDLKPGATDTVAEGKFGFVNAGVQFSAVGPISWIVLVSLVAGKPIGIVLTTMLAQGLGFRRSKGLDYKSLVTLGIAAGIGFTVALFFTTAAFPPGPRELQHLVVLEFFLEVFAVGEEVEELEAGFLRPCHAGFDAVVEKLFEEVVPAGAAPLDLDEIGR